MSIQVASAASGELRDRHYAYASTLAQWFRTLLLESASTNSNPYSSDLTQLTNYGFTQTSALKNATGPDGVANSASTLIENSATNFHYVQNTALVITANTKQSISVFLKANGRTKGIVYLDGIGGDFGATFDLTAVTLANYTTGTGSVFSKRIVPYGNGWYRIEVSGIQSAAGVLGSMVILMQDASGTSSYAGDGVSGLLVYGVQHEVDKIIVSSYIPTLATAVTRNADALSFPYTQPPKALSLYYKIVVNGNNPAINQMVTVGSTSGNYFTVRLSGAAVQALLLYGANSTSSSAVSVSPGDVFEILGTLTSDGRARASYSKNSAAVVQLTTGSAVGLPSAWTTQAITLSEAALEPNGGIVAVALADGVQTMAAMRSIAGV